MNKILLATTLTLGLTVAPLIASPAIAAPAASVSYVTKTTTAAPVKATVVKASTGGVVLFNPKHATATVFTKTGVSYVAWAKTKNSSTAGTWNVTVNASTAFATTQTVETEGLNSMLKTLKSKATAKHYAYTNRDAVVKAVKASVKGHTV